MSCAIHGVGPCICLGARYWMDKAKRLTADEKEACQARDAAYKLCDEYTATIEHLTRDVTDNHNACLQRDVTIERLTAERDAARYQERNWQDRHHVMQAAKKRAECDAMAAEAERDRLTATVEELRTVSAGLRAALEQIAKMPPHQCATLAREALAGIAIQDESRDAADG